jgi:plasmid stabilization system protein ParE
VTLRILDDAEAEIETARQYYNLQAYALGDRFLDDLAQTLNRIAASPNTFPKLETLPDSEPYRRALLKIFQYAVIFEIRATEIVVMAVAHTSRKPNYWLKRLS